jgi:hypothetical protein
VVVAAAAGDDALLRREVAVGTPVVYVDRMLPDVECDTVVSSDRASTRAAVAQLHDVGHERVAFLGGDQDQGVWTARERMTGHRDARHDAGLVSDRRRSRASAASGGHGRLRARGRCPGGGRRALRMRASGRSAPVGVTPPRADTAYKTIVVVPFYRLRIERADPVSERRGGCTTSRWAHNVEVGADVHP